MHTLWAATSSELPTDTFTLRECQQALLCSSSDVGLLLSCIQGGGALDGSSLASKVSDRCDESSSNQQASTVAHLHTSMLSSLHSRLLLFCAATMQVGNGGMETPHNGPACGASARLHILS